MSASNQTPTHFGHHDRLGIELLEITNAIVRLYKELFGRGATKARSDYAGPDILVVSLENSLTPAERRLVALGEHGRVLEVRQLFRRASERDFVTAVERITGREVRAFLSDTDTGEDVAAEIFYLEPVAPS